MKLTFAQVDRAAGALLGLACGDALGAAYEFATPPQGDAEMIGGGLGDWEPGEWTDDTQMALCIAEEAATGRLDATAVAERFLDWFRGGPADMGIQTSAVMAAAERAEDLPEVAVEYYRDHPRGGAGNGSLMRTAPVALARLGDDDGLASAAMEVSALTHGDPLAGEACVLWCTAIDRAVREGRLHGVWEGLDLLPAGSRDYWAARLDEARHQPPDTFRPNGFVVAALQAAYAALTHTPVPAEMPCLHLQYALQAAVGVGDDTDTVAAIAGSLLGARWGASAVPFRWRRRLHGWPGYRDRDLVRLAVLSVRGGRPDPAGWPSAPDLLDYYTETGPHQPFLTPLPGDDGVILGNAAALPRSKVDAVVSLCRMGTHQVPDAVEHHEVFLVDEEGANPNLAFAVCDAVDAIAALREEGRNVFVHCVAGASRTPTVAALYLSRRLGITPSQALERVTAVVSYSPHNRELGALLERDAVCAETGHGLHLHGRELVAAADRLAERAHRGQTDNAGEPYIEHSRRVAASLSDAELQAAGLLHDVLEDTDLTVGDLRAAGVGELVIELVVTVTKRPDEDYRQAVRRAAVHPLARQVKRADLQDNLDPARLARLDDVTARRLRSKYRAALEILDKGGRPE
ncbi:MAG: ADP-ribosylglycohydrolase family protein [Actinomycetota bacterium]|nr:ADP-ribosylglycohydrolase family protein [Actinomycetota bacterium]